MNDRLGNDVNYGCHISYWSTPSLKGSGSCTTGTALPILFSASFQHLTTRNLETRQTTRPVLHEVTSGSHTLEVAVCWSSYSVKWGQSRIVLFAKYSSLNSQLLIIAWHLISIIHSGFISSQGLQTKLPKSIPRRKLQQHTKKKKKMTTKIKYWSPFHWTLLI